MNIDSATAGSGWDNDLETSVGRVENGERLSAEVDRPMTLGIEQILAADSDHCPRRAAGWAHPGDGGRRLDGKRNPVARLRGYRDHQVAGGGTVRNGDGDGGIGRCSRPGSLRSWFRSG
jgi:hypothetical protein